MTTFEVRVHLTTATESLARIGTPRELPADRAIVQNLLKEFAGQAIKYAVRKQMSMPKVIVAGDSGFEKAAATK